MMLLHMAAAVYWSFIGGRIGMDCYQLRCRLKTNKHTQTDEQTNKTKLQHQKKIWKVYISFSNFFFIQSIKKGVQIPGWGNLFFFLIKLSFLSIETAVNHQYMNKKAYSSVKLAAFQWTDIICEKWEFLFFC